MKKILFLLAIFGLGLKTVTAQYTDLFDFNGATGAFSSSDITNVGNKLYGMASQGGVNGIGLIFSMDKNGSNFKDRWDFKDTGSLGNANGKYPVGNLILSGNVLYGMTLEGGAHNEQGIIFRIDTDGSNFKDLFDFFLTTGGNPYGSLTLVGNVLYGMTETGGAYNDGVIFSINTNGANYKDLFDFNGTNGSEPRGALIVAGKSLYGMAILGGAHNDGLVFSVDTNGHNYKDLFDFNVTNGWSPQGNLILSGKTLYGMTPLGGANSNGIIFSIDTNGGNYKDLLNFNGTSGANPDGSLIRSGNLLYGTTSAGGTNNDGVIFSIDTNGSHYTDIYNFDGTSGKSPYADVTLSDDVLYGTTFGGGRVGPGVVFGFGVCGLLTAIHDSLPDDGTNNGLAAVTAGGGPTPYTYFWSPGNKTTDTIKNLSAGTYSCTITDANGCSLFTTVTVNSTAGTNAITISPESINVYPNPGNGLFQLEIKNEESGMNNIIEVYNMLGEKIYSHNQIANPGSYGESNYQIDLSSQPSGVYLYRAITTNGNLIRQGKLIIQK